MEFRKFNPSVIDQTDVSFHRMNRMKESSDVFMGTDLLNLATIARFVTIIFDYINIHI